MDGKTMTFDGQDGDSTTISCSTPINGTTNFAKATQGTLANVTISAGCTVSVGSVNNTNMDQGAVIVSGTMNHTGSTFNIDNGSLTLSSGGTITYAGTNITIERNYTDNGGTWDLTGKTMTFDADDESSILSCSSSSLGSVVINKVGGPGAFTLGSTCTIGGNFTRTDGPFNNPSSAYTLTIQGNFSMSTTDAFGGPNLTLEMGGSQSTQTMTQNAGTINNNIRINKSSGTAQLSTSLTTNGAATASAGTFDVNGSTFTAGQGFTVEDGATFELFGSETVTSPTLNSGSTVKYTGDGGADVDGYTLKDYSYHHLTIASVDSGDTYATPNATEDVLGHFTLSGGAFTAPSGNFTISGNFTHSGGTYSHNNGTVVINNANQTTTFSGNTTFRNLSSTTAGKKIYFAQGSTQTVTNTFTITGTAGAGRIDIRGASHPFQWNIDSQGTESVSYARVEDSNACEGNTITAANSSDLGNNTCWSFSSSTPAASKVQGGVNIRGGTRLQ
jgi:hypothetical protein